MEKRSYIRLMVKHCDLGSVPAVTWNLKINKSIITTFSMMIAIWLENE